MIVRMLDKKMPGRTVLWRTPFSWSRYWAVHNFSPSSDGDTNLAALNTALDNFSVVRITEAGVYDFSNTIYIPSNTTLIVCEGVTFRKETGSNYTHIIANKGMLTNTSDSNIEYYGNNAILDINGIDTYSLTDTNINPILRLRSIFQFHKVDNFIVDGIKINDINIEDQYCVNFNDCSNGSVNDLDILADKDACPVTACRDINFTNLVFQTRDDGMFLGIGYPNACVTAKNTERISIDGLTLNTPIINGGWISRMFTGTWDDWQTGYTYSELDMCVSAGRIYGRGFGTGGDLVSSVAPTHSSGAVTGADGIEWWVMDGDPVYKIDVIDCTFKNVTVNYDRQLFLLANLSIDGARERGKVDGLVIDNISLQAAHTEPLIQWATRIGDLTIKNSTILDGSGSSDGILYAQDYGGAIGEMDTLIIDNCTLNFANANLAYMNKNDAIINELRFINSSLTLAKAVAYVAATTAQIGKLTMTGGSIVYTGTEFLGLRANQYDGNNEFTNVDITTTILAKPLVAGATGTVTLVNCAFKTSLGYVCVVTVAGGAQILYSSRGTTYIEPSGYLFFTNQAAGTVTIDVLSSSGAVTPAKVRNGANVTVTNCDLPYV